MFPKRLLFTRSATNATHDPTKDTSPATSLDADSLYRDVLHAHQLMSSNFLSLDERSIYVAGVVDSERVSKLAFRALQKHEILDKEGRVDTYKIGPKFIHQLAMLHKRRQKELINLLFWWEEECYRFSKLRDEEEELNTLIKEAEPYMSDDEGSGDNSRKGMLDQLRFARERVRMKIRQRPSQRRADTEADTDNLMEVFGGRAPSAPTLTMMLTEADSWSASPLGNPGDALPEYHQIAARRQTLQ